MLNSNNSHYYGSQQEKNHSRSGKPDTCRMAFFFGGFGQLVQGRMLAGLLWLFTEYILGSALMFLTFGLGIVFTFFTRVLCIIDAANYKPRAGRDVGKLVIAGLCLNGGVLLLTILFWGALIGSSVN